MADRRGDRLRGTPVLVGRERELASLWARFEAAAAGHAGVVLVAGEPGIGKTRLLSEVAIRVGDHGAEVLRGGASEAEGMPPYLPFLEALGQYIRTVPVEQLREQTREVASPLTTIFPELPSRLGDSAPSYRLPPEQARLRLYEAIGLFLANIASERPLVILLDDLQWADSASLDLLCHVVRQQPDVRLLILGAYREGEVAQNPALERTLAELNRLRMLTTIFLRPLAEDEIGAIADRSLGAPLEAAARRLLYRQCEGNPFFAEELVRGWSEDGALARAGREWRVVPSLEERLPASVVGAVRQRLARLPADVVDLLRTAAIVGRTFDAALLAEASGQEVEAVEDLLIVADRAGLIRTVGESLFSFTHDKIRECLYGEVTPVRRRRLHGFIGRALELHSDPTSAQHLAELAFHFARSGDRPRGAAYSQCAAEQAMQAYAAEDAMAFYRAALGLLETGDPRRGALLVGLGRAAILAGAEDEAASAFEAALSWYRGVGDSVAAAQAAHGLGQARWRQEQLPAARAAFETALSLLEDCRCTETVEVLVDLTSLLVVSLSQPADGFEHGKRALELARELGDARLEAAASRTVGNLLVRWNDIPTGLPLLQRALELATVADDPSEAAECCSCLSLAYFWKGAAQQGADMMARRLEFGRRCHDPYQMRHAYTWWACWLAYEGKWTEAEDMLARARAVVERLASPEPLAFYYNIRGALAWWRGDYSTAEEMFTQSTTLYRAMGPSTLVWFLGPLGLVQLRQGKRREALACVDELEALVAAQPPGTIAAADSLIYLGMIAVLLDDRERAARYYPQLLPFAGLNVDVLVDRVLGELKMVLGDWATAEEHIASAEELARREHLAPEIARLAEARANLALARGGRGSAWQAREWLARAVAIFQEFGALGEVRRVRELLRNLPRQPGPRGREPLPAGLSEREAAVLRLVAQGKSNRQIAAELALSEKTVANHLTAVFGKIGADNRAAATAFAVRHGLA